MSALKIYTRVQIMLPAIIGLELTAADVWMVFKETVIIAQVNNNKFVSFPFFVVVGFFNFFLILKILINIKLDSSWLIFKYTSVFFILNSECTDFTFGSNCSQSCKCNKSNTDSCNPVTGQCSCTSGWTGIHCSTDIDECRDNLTKCSTSMYHVCINTPGSAYCDCQFGGRNSTLCNGTRVCLPELYCETFNKT